MIVHGDPGVGGSNARKHVVEEPKNAPGIFFNMLNLGVNHALKAIVKQGNAALNLAQVIRD